MRLSDLFTSKSRTRILEVLWLQERPLGLRRISDLAETPVSVTSRTLKQLKKEGILTTRTQGNVRAYILSPEHEAFELIRAVFRVAQNRARETTKQGYGDTPKAALAFASEAVEIFRTLRKNTPR